MSDPNEWKDWVAVCPKCEKFYTLKAYRPDYFCAHPSPIKNMFQVRSVEVLQEPEIEKVACKIVPIKRIKA